MGAEASVWFVSPGLGAAEQHSDRILCIMLSAIRVDDRVGELINKLIMQLHAALDIFGLIQKVPQCNHQEVHSKSCCCVLERKCYQRLFLHLFKLILNLIFHTEATICSTSEHIAVNKTIH